VFVQTRELACVVSVEPSAIVPTAPPPDALGLLDEPGFDVTVLPDLVVVGAGVLGVCDEPELERRGVVRGSLFVDDGAFVPEAGGTSLSCGCAVESWPASARSRFSVVSAPSAVVSGPCFCSPRQAPSATVATS